MTKNPPIASSKTPIIGETLPGTDLTIDPKRLLVGRLLVQANSGGGKSRTLRRLLEQTHGIYQQIVIDPEGEFSTLREKYDYVLFGPNGDYPIGDIKNAPLLARRLLELRVSAIIDIYDLGVSQALWVKGFLEALVHAPKTLWHPVSVVLDEAHKFCPERGEGDAVSTAAVLDLMTLGRKRGFSGWLATQRIAKLHKSAASECNNKLIGRTGQDDIARAAKELGLKGDNAQSLRRLRPGQFYAYGNAICDDVTLVQVGPVETTHPESGELTPLPQPPRSEIRKVLGQFADLPKEAQAEARTTDDLRARVRELESQVKSGGRDLTVERDLRSELAARTAERDEVRRLSAELTTSLQTWKNACVSELRSLVDRIGAVAPQDVVTSKWEVVQRLEGVETTNPSGSKRQVRDAMVTMNGSPQTGRSTQQREPLRKDMDSVTGAGSRQRSSGLQANASESGVTAGETAPIKPALQRVLDTIALVERLGIEPSPETFAAWYGSANSRGFNNYLSELRTKGYLDGLTLTSKGKMSAQVIDIPSQEALRERILRPLPATLRRVMDVVIAHGPIQVNLLAESVGSRPTRGFLNYVSALRTRGLVQPGWPARASKVFYMEGLR